MTNDSPVYKTPDQDISSTGYVPVEAIIYSYYIKYEELWKLSEQVFASSNSDVLDIYIDFYGMIRSFYNRSLTGVENMYTSMVLNLAAHLRHFYMSRYRVRTNIYIVFTTNSINITLTKVPEWNMTDTVNVMMSPQRDKVIGWNREMLKLLCPYFHNVYYLEGTVDPALMIYNRIMRNRQKANCPVMILTKDTFAWQIPSLLPEVAVFRPRKTHTGDTSFAVNQYNVIEQWRRHVKKTELFVESFLHPSMLSLYIAMTSYRERGLKSYYSPKDTLTIINRLLSEGKIKNGYNYPLNISAALQEITKATPSPPGDPYFFVRNSMLERYMDIDLSYMYSLYSFKPEAKDDSMYVQKFDMRSVMQINDEFFRENPINIIHLNE